VARFLSGLFGSNKQTQAPATSLRVNTSLQGVPIAIFLGGKARLSGNVLDYFGFLATSAPSSSGGKGGVTGGGKGQSAGYTYSTSFIMGICEGPIAQGAAYLINGADTAFGVNGVELFLGDYAQTPWGYAEAVEPTRALAYRGICYIVL
jgi:hypothetical protein